MTIHESQRLTQLLTHRSTNSLSITSVSPSSKQPSPSKNYDEKYLRIQIQRQIDRVLQKISKLSSSAHIASLSPADEKTKFKTLQERHCKLLQFQDTLNALTPSSSSVVISPDTLNDFLAFGLQLCPPLRAKQPQPPSSTSSPLSSKSKVEPRKPFKLYQTVDQVDLLVGRSAAENDLISLSSQYCHPDDWWLHVAHLPGSHVIIKYQQDDLPLARPQSLYDAAVLAIHFSKSTSTSFPSREEVTVTRGRYVSKRRNDPPGMVVLELVDHTLAIHTSSQKYLRALKRLLDQKQ
jgi:hypothetical protein